jgi:hypothetical protein
MPTDGCPFIKSLASPSNVHRNRTSANPTFGLFSMSSSITFCESTMVRTREIAVALAVRSPPSRLAISPKILPEPACAKDSSRPSLDRIDRRMRPARRRSVSRRRVLTTKLSRQKSA